MLAVCCTQGSTCFAQQAEVKTGKSPAFILATSDTQLQKRLLGLDPGLSVKAWYLELNGNRFFKSSGDSDEQWARQAKAIDAIKQKDSGIFVSVTFYGDVNADKMPSVRSRLNTKVIPSSCFLTLLRQHASTPLPTLTGSRKSHFANLKKKTIPGAAPINAPMASSNLKKLSVWKMVDRSAI